MNGPPGSATPFSHLRYRVRSSAAGSRSAQARRSSSLRHRRILLSRRDTWQAGPDAGAAFLGKNFIAYAFVQQWFKVGGDGEDTDHMNGASNFTDMLANGLTIGTQPNLSVDWEAPEDNRVAFSIGPQIR